SAGWAAGESNAAAWRRSRARSGRRTTTAKRPGRARTRGTQAKLPRARRYGSGDATAVAGPERAAPPRRRCRSEGTQAHRGQREGGKREDIAHGGAGAEREIAERLYVDAPRHHVARVARPALGQDEEQIEMPNRHHCFVDKDEGEARPERRQRHVKEAFHHI